MKDQPELLSCPFCGKEAAIRESAGSSSLEGAPIYQAHCKFGECAESPWEGWESEAVQWWNRRSLPSQAHDIKGWRDIESAPKDGTVVLVGHETAAFDAWWDVGLRAWVDGTTSGYDDDLIPFAPTHWLPLPDPPAISAAPIPLEGESDQGAAQDHAAAAGVKMEGGT